MFDYRINIDKKVLRLLGAQLYGDTPSIIAELVQNAYDADAKEVWITVNTHNPSCIVVQDNGIGMTPEEVNDRFLNIGQDRRTVFPTSPSGRKVLGRKGIGKLAVFSLAKVVNVYSIKDNQKAACCLDFDEITLHDGNPQELSTDFTFNKDFLSPNGTGTKIELHSIQKDISRSLNYIVNRLARTFDVNDEDFKLYVRKNGEEFIPISRKELNYFEHMDTIVTFGKQFDSKIDDVQNNEINKRYKFAAKYENLSAEKKMQIMPYQIQVINKDGVEIDCNFSFSGWIGTIHERQLFKNFITKNYSEEGKTKFEVTITDNRVTVFSRGKIGEFDILPKTQTNRIADAYVIGEIYADIFEDDNLVDMAISNRRGYDETDQRYVQMIRIVSDVVSFVTRRKEEINKKKKQDADIEIANVVKQQFQANSPKTQKVIKTKFTDDEKKDFEEELFQFGRALNMTSSTKKIFISHKAECAQFGKFLVRCFELVGLDINNTILFTSMPELGVPYDQDIYDYLKSCFRDDLYVVFLFSRSFYNSNVCIAETGAAWATNQKYSNIVLDMGFGGIDKPINNCQIGISLNNLDAPDLKYGICQLIKNALLAIGYTDVPAENLIIKSITKALSEFEGLLTMPLYKPERRYLAVPICPECGSHMTLSINQDGSLQYVCIARKCSATLEAEIE